MKQEILHKEIDLIQSVISRMANNTFILKGWLISLITVILALSKDTLLTNDVTYLSFILCFPVIVFWYLDAFFLHKERCYRKLYDWVIENRNTSDKNLYSLDYTRFTKEVNGVFRIMFSNTLFPFYGFTMVVLLVVGFYNVFV